MPDRRPVRKVTANAGDGGMREKCILSAKVIVSSDDDLPTLGSYQGITILSPAQASRASIKSQIVPLWGHAVMGSDTMP